MAVQILKLAGREFVILPKREYALLNARAVANGSKAARGRKPSKQELGDIAEIKRQRQAGGKNIPWEQVKRELKIQ